MADLTDGTLTLIVQDDHAVTLDSNGDINVSKLSVGEGTSGSFLIGGDATQQTLTVQELIEVKSGASLIPNSEGAPAHIIKLYGNLMSVLVMMKGLPLSYNRDMQLDKPGLFSSLDIIKGELEVLPDLVESLNWNKKVIKERVENDEALYATDILYHLVKKGIPFLNAHELVGKLVKYSGDTGQKIRDMNDKTLSRISGKLKHNEIVKIMSPETSVKSRISIER